MKEDKRKLIGKAVLRWTLGMTILLLVVFLVYFEAFAIYLWSSYLKYSSDYLDKVNSLESIAKNTTVFEEKISLYAESILLLGRLNTLGHVVILNGVISMLLALLLIPVIWGAFKLWKSIEI